MIYTTPFDVTRVHGMNALGVLAKAYKVDCKRQEYETIVSGETKDETFQNGGINLSELKYCNETLFSQLATVVILYQASMEAAYADAVSCASKLQELENTGFVNNWINALDELGQSTKEFNEYGIHFYKKLRISLTHLYPDTDKRLKDINAMTFEQVYTGVRYGWWAYIRLIYAAHDWEVSDISENWASICSKIELPADLFKEKLPAA